MTLNRTYSGHLATTIVAAFFGLCLGTGAVQAGNPWNPSSMQQATPVPQPTAPVAKPKYYQEEPAAGLAPQTAPPSPSRFAPADLSQRLSAPTQRPQNALPYGYLPPNAQAAQNSPAYFGQPQAYANGYPQGNQPNYPVNAPAYLGGYGGGYGPPVIGNNSWGGGPFNNSFPFGF